MCQEVGRLLENTVLYYSMPVLFHGAMVNAITQQ